MDNKIDNDDTFLQELTGMNESYPLTFNYFINIDLEQVKPNLLPEGVAVVQTHSTSLPQIYVDDSVYSHLAPFVWNASKNQVVEYNAIFRGTQAET